MSTIFWVIIAVIELFLYLLISRKRSRVRQMLIYIVVLIGNIGFSALSNATTLSEALLANKFASIGAIFMLALLFFNVEDICGVSSRWLEIITTFAAISWVIVEWTVGYTTVFYREVDLGVGPYGSYLITQKGVLFVISYISTGIILGVILLTFRNVYKAKLQVSKRTVTSMLILLSVTGVVYMLGGYGLFGTYEYHPLVNTICATVFLFISARVQTHDLSANVLEALVQLDNLGYILLDDDFSYMAHSSLAEKIFPQLTDYVVDEPIEDMEFLDKVLDWYNTNGSEFTVIQEGNYWLECRMICANYPTDQVYIVVFTDETDRHNLLEMSQKYSEHLKVEVKEQIDKVEKVQDSIVLGMAQVVESRDNSTGGHVKRSALAVKCFISYLKQHIGYPEKYWDCIIKAAPLHDIGKVAIDDDILRKPGRFTDEEYQQMKEHAQNGADLLQLILQDVSDQEFKGVAINVANYHHEKYDGTGYPKGLKGLEIPFEARVMALADVFDALVSKRCYKDAYDYDKAFDIIASERGKQFDPDLCTLFLECRKDLIELYDGFFSQVERTVNQDEEENSFSSITTEFTDKLVSNTAS